MLLAIETSCDETAVALFDSEAAFRGDGVGSKDLLYQVVSSQVELHEAYGGVVPELASRAHSANLPLLVRDSLEKTGAKASDLRAIAVTRGPGLKGCLLVGLCFAKGLAAARGIPLLALHHIEGHIYCSALMEEENQLLYPALVLVVSGGHTMLILLKSFRQYQVIAATRDDAAGEAFDKIASLLNLPYPGGPALAKKAEKGDPLAFEFPRGMASDPEHFSFSGLKTAVLRTVDGFARESLGEKEVADIAASSQEAIVDSLVSKTLLACSRYSPKSVMLTGGVAANTSLRERLSGEIEGLGMRFIVPPIKLCTDNAAMMGVLGAQIIASGAHEYASWRPSSSLLGPGVPQNVAAMPRWPIEEVC